MCEIWRPVPGYPHMEASNTGRVRTITRVINVAASSYRPAYQKTVRGRILSEWRNKGRCSVAVEGATFNVGRLVCLAFHGEPTQDTPNALHRDDNSWNNVSANLYWGNQRQNSIDAHLSERRRGGLNPHAKLTESQALEIRVRRLAGERGSDLAREFNVSQQLVNDIRTGRVWGWLKNAR